MEAPKIRVLVVDDYTPWCRFVCSMLEKRPEFQVVGEVSDGLEAVQKAQELQPNLILLDIGLPSLSGIEAARRIREVSPTSTVLFVSANRSWDIAQEAMRTGGSGYVVKSNAASELLPAIEAVLQGKPFLSGRWTGHEPILEEDEHASSHARHEKVVVPSRPQNLETNRHELKLYSDDAAFVDDFANSIKAALETGNAASLLRPNHTGQVFFSN